MVKVSPSVKGSTSQGDVSVADKIFLVKSMSQKEVENLEIIHDATEISPQEIELLKGLIADEIYYKENHELTKGQFKFVFDKLKNLLKKLESV